MKYTLQISEVGIPTLTAEISILVGQPKDKSVLDKVETAAFELAKRFDASVDIFNEDGSYHCSVRVKHTPHVFQLRK